MMKVEQNQAKQANNLPLSAEHGNAPSWIYYNLLLLATQIDIQNAVTATARGLAVGLVSPALTDPAHMTPIAQGTYKAYPESRPEE